MSAPPPIQEGIYTITHDHASDLHAEDENVVAKKDVKTKWRIGCPKDSDLGSYQYSIALDTKLWPESCMTLNTKPGPDENNIKIRTLSLPESYESALWTFEDLTIGINTNDTRMPPATYTARIQNVARPGLAAGIGKILVEPPNVEGVESKPGEENQTWIFTYQGSD